MSGSVHSQANVFCVRFSVLMKDIIKKSLNRYGTPQDSTVCRKKIYQVIDGVQGENGTASGPCKAEMKNSLHHICAIQQSQVTPHFLGKKMTAIKIPVSSDITKLDSYHSLKVNQNGTETLEYTY